MRRRVSSVRTLSVAGTVLVLAGVVLVGVSAVAAKKGPALRFTPDTNIGTTQGVLVTVSNFKRHTKGGLSQCNVTPGEPMISDPTTGQPEPVGCGPFAPIKTTANGGLPNPSGFGIEAGVNGPPASGSDSSGSDAAADAQNYPCPPTAAQVAVGGACVIVFTDVLGQTASETIDYNFESTTTTTMAPPAGCTPLPVTTTVGATTLTVGPATCLVGEKPADLIAWGLKPSVLGSVLECNAAPGQPTVFVNLASKSMPIGCTSITSDLLTTTASGGLPSGASFTILTGTVGPPATGTDSSGGNAATDAANYPCPPTPAQYASGVACTLTFGDLGGDQLTVPLSFGASPCRDVIDGVLAGITRVTSASVLFTAADIGASIKGVDIPAGTTVASVTSSSQAAMSNPATGSATGVTLTICH